MIANSSIYDPSETQSSAEHAGYPVSDRPFDPMRPHEPGERRLWRAKYLHHLRERDGSVNFDARVLTRREAFFDQIKQEPVSWHAELDRDSFFRYLNRKPDGYLDPKVVWLLGASKVNRSEKFGIELSLKLGEGREAPSEFLNHIALQEFYHTRILLECCRSVGLDVEILPPAPMMRAMTNLMARLPERPRLPLTLTSEIVGCVFFALLLENIACFDEGPEVRERLRALMRDILIDEIGHVAYCRSGLSNPEIAFARALLPLMQRTLLNDMPEYVQIAGSVEAFSERVRNFDVARDPFVAERCFREPERMKE